MRKILSYENPVFQFFIVLADLCISNMLTLLFSLPIVTIGAAISANHRVSQSIVFKEDRSVFRLFFRTFKENFKNATIVWLVQLLLFAVLGFNVYQILIFFDGVLKTVLIVLACVFALSIAGITAFVFPLLVRYSNNLKEHFRNALLLLISKPFLAFFLVAIHAIPFALAAVSPNAFVATVPFWLLIGFSLMTLWDNYILKRTLRQLEEKRDGIC